MTIDFLVNYTRCFPYETSNYVIETFEYWVIQVKLTWNNALSFSRKNWDPPTRVFSEVVKKTSKKITLQGAYVPTVQIS